MRISSAFSSLSLLSPNKKPNTSPLPFSRSDSSHLSPFFYSPNQILDEKIDFYLCGAHLIVNSGLDCLVGHLFCIKRVFNFIVGPIDQTLLIAGGGSDSSSIGAPTCYIAFFGFYGFI